MVRSSCPVAEFQIAENGSAEIDADGGSGRRALWALWNLLDNAVKYFGDSREIEVKRRGVELNPAADAVVAWAFDGSLLFTDHQCSYCGMDQQQESSSRNKNTVGDLGQAPWLLIVSGERASSGS